MVEMILDVLYEVQHIRQGWILFCRYGGCRGV